MHTTQQTVLHVVHPSTGNTQQTNPTGDKATEARRQRVLAILRDNLGIRYALVTDTESNPDAVIVAMAIRGRATCELLIPRDRYDGTLLLDLIEHHGGTVH